MACPEPAGAMEQESAYVAALARAVTWTIRDCRLQLRDENGSLQVDYRPADEVPTTDQLD
jgi:heat shock protein HslJ